MKIRSLVPFRDRGFAAPEVYSFGSLQRQIDRLFDDFARSFGASGASEIASLAPSIDVTETDKQIEITAELPGLERKDVEISLEDNILVVRGEKKVEQEQKDEKNKDAKKDKSYRLSERSYGVFYRAIELPAGVDASSIQATMSKGVLKVVIPKPPHAQTKKIEIKEAS